MVFFKDEHFTVFSKVVELAILLSALRCRYVVGLKSTKDGFRRKESRYSA